MNNMGVSLMDDPLLMLKLCHTQVIFIIDIIFYIKKWYKTLHVLKIYFTANSVLSIRNHMQPVQTGILVC